MAISWNTQALFQALETEQWIKYSLYLKSLNSSVYSFRLKSYLVYMLLKIKTSDHQNNLSWINNELKFGGFEEGQYTKTVEQSGCQLKPP